MCTCKNTDFADLPMVKWMNDGVQYKLETPISNSNSQNEVI